MTYLAVAGSSPFAPNHSARAFDFRDLSVDGSVPVHAAPSLRLTSGRLFL